MSDPSPLPLSCRSSSFFYHQRVKRSNPGRKRSVRHQFIHPNISVSLFFSSSVLHFRMLPGAHPWPKSVGSGVKSRVFIEILFDDFFHPCPKTSSQQLVYVVPGCAAGKNGLHSFAWKHLEFELLVLWRRGQIMKNILSLQRYPHCRGPRNQQVLLKEHHSSKVVFGTKAERSAIGWKIGIWFQNVILLQFWNQKATNILGSCALLKQKSHIRQI